MMVDFNKFSALNLYKNKLWSSLHQLTNLLVIMLGLVGMFSCINNPKGDSFPDFFQDVEEVDLERIPFEIANDSVFFSRMVFLGYIDSVIVVNEFSDPDYTFKLVDLKSGTVKRFGKRGEGPNQLLNEGGYFLLNHSDNQLIIGDGNFNYTYDVDRLFDQNPQPVNSFRFNLEDDRFLGHRVLTAGRVVGSTYLKRFGYYTISDQLFKVYEDYPGGEQQALAHQAYFVGHPSRFQFAYGMRSYPEFGIFQDEEGEMKSEKWNWGNKYSEAEEFEDGTRVVLGGENDELHFYSTAAGVNSIFLVHSGEKLRDTSGKPRKEGLLTDHVYQLGWDGQPKAILRLGQEVIAITVDPNENLLFVSSATKEPELLIYKLP